MVEILTFVYVCVISFYVIVRKFYLFDFCSIINFKSLLIVFYFPNLMFNYLLASFLILCYNMK